MPTIQKMLLKNDGGKVRAVMTFRLGEECPFRFPSGFRPIAVETDGKITLCETGELPPLPKNISHLSLLGESGEERLFASTLTGDAAAFAKWRLTELSEREKAPTSPLKDAPTVATEIAATEQTDPEEEIAAPPATENESPLDRARRLLKEGEPFSLFDSLIPQSRWAKIENEDCLCLVGIVTDGEKERVLYGVAGVLGFPPDEDRLWTYFPTSEEEGFYLSEYEQA